MFSKNVCIWISTNLLPLIIVVAVVVALAVMVVVVVGGLVDGAVLGLSALGNQRLALVPLVGRGAPVPAPLHLGGPR